MSAYSSPGDRPEGAGDDEQHRDRLFGPSPHSDDTPIDGIVLDGLDGRWDDWDDEDWDDEDDDSPISGPVRDPADRVWRHPSEVCRPRDDAEAGEGQHGRPGPVPTSGEAADASPDSGAASSPDDRRPAAAMAASPASPASPAGPLPPVDMRTDVGATASSASTAGAAGATGLDGLRRIIGRFDGPTGPVPPTRPARPERSTRRALLTMAAMFAMGALVTVTVIGLVSQTRQEPTFLDTISSSTSSTARPGAASVADRVRPSLVHLSSSAGPGVKVSGLVYRPTGEIVTSARFVNKGGKITATLANGTQTPASVVGVDNESDVAVVRVNTAALEAARVIASSSLRPGVPAVAVGVDDTGRDITVTSGVVAGTRRTLDLSEGDGLLGLIQVDRPVAPSCSGGALLNAQGDVVGLLVAGDQPSHWGYAIPGDAVIQVADQLIEKGRMEWAWLGIDGATSSSQPGVVVRRVRVANPDKRHQLNLEDVITRVDGMPVTSVEQLNLMLRAYRPGNQVDVTVHRKGMSANVDLRLTLLTRDS